MPNHSQYEREEDDIERRYAEGWITLEQRNKELRELRRDWQGAAEEAAEKAYRDEMERW